MVKEKEITSNIDLWFSFGYIEAFIEQSLKKEKDEKILNHLKKIENYLKLKTRYKQEYVANDRGETNEKR